MTAVDDIIRQIAALPEAERHQLYDRITTAIAGLSAPTGYIAEIDENQSLSSCIDSKYFKTPSIRHAIPFVYASRIYDSSYKDTYIKKENIKERKEKKEGQQPTNLGFVNDKNAAAVAEEWVKIYADVCKSYPQVAKLTETRIEMVGRRSERFSTENFRQACINMEQCDWMKGRGFGSFDWIVKSDENLAKLAEGYYNQKRRPASAHGTLQGRPAVLAKLIDNAARCFDKVVDSIGLAKMLDEAITADAYYSQLGKDDIEEIFRRGCTRQYEYHGLTVAAFCGWMNAYKDTFKDKQRRAKMAADAANRK